MLLFSEITLPNLVSAVVGGSIVGGLILGYFKLVVLTETDKHLRTLEQVLANIYVTKETHNLIVANFERRVSHLEDDKLVKIRENS